jgi:hypothetical protein
MINEKWSGAWAVSGGQWAVGKRKSLRLFNLQFAIANLQ